MGTIDHIATESEAAEGVLNHIVDGVEPRVAALEGCTLFGADGTDLKCFGVPYLDSFDTDISECVGVEAVGEMVAATASDVDVCLGEWRLGIAVVEVLHRDLLTKRHLFKYDIKPSCHYSSEVEQDAAVGKLLDALRFDGVYYAVALKLLPGYDYVLCIIDLCSGCITAAYTGIVPLAAELHRLPVAGIAIG